MNNPIGYDALPRPQEDSFPSNSEDPLQIRSALIARILLFVADMEELLTHPLLTVHMDFLDKIANHLVALESLVISSRICSTLVQENSQLVDNILKCMIAVKDQKFALSILDAAKIYRRNRKMDTPLAVILKSCYELQPTTKSLLNDLKILAFDLSVETENI